MISFLKTKIKQIIYLRNKKSLHTLGIDFAQLKVISSVIGDDDFNVTYYLIL